MMLTFQFSFFGSFLAGNGRGHHTRPLWSGASKPDQKVVPLGGRFGSTAIPKLCFEIFMGEPSP